MIKFSGENCTGLINGKKVATSRLDDNWRAGEVHFVKSARGNAIGFIRIISVERIYMVEITTEQLLAEGFKFRTNYFSEITNHYPDAVITWRSEMYYIVFEVVSLTEYATRFIEDKPEEPEDERCES